MSEVGNNIGNNNAQPPPIGELNILSTSTPKSYRTSAGKWDSFVDKQNGLFAANGNDTRYLHFKDLTEEFVCGTVLENGSMLNSTPPIAVVMSQFAQFLFDDTKSDGNPYAPLVLVQYLSGIKAMLFKKFKPLSFNNNDSPQWYSELYRGLHLRATALCIKRGGKVSKKHVGIARKTLLACLLYILKNSKDGYEERAVIAILFHAVGRSSEIAATAWESAEWEDDREHLLFDWGEIKNGQQYIMTLHPSADPENGWILDAIHSIACDLICGSSGYKASASAEETGINFMFKGYFDMGDGGAASKVSRIFDKCRVDGGVPDLSDDFTSHGLRVAAADEMMFNVYLPFFAAIARGGWDCKADTLLFYYLTQKKHVAAAGKALAGWVDPNVHVHAPSLEAIYNDNNRGAIDRFCHRLFMHTSVSTLLDNKLKAFRSRMVASLLMYYPNVRKELGTESRIINAIKGAWLDCNLEIKDLLVYADMIKKQFCVKNALNLAASSSDTKEVRLEKAFNALQATTLETLDKVKSLEGEVSTIKEVVVDMHGMLETLCSKLSTSPSSSPARKRAKADDTPAPPSTLQAVASKPNSNFLSFTEESRKHQAKSATINWDEDIGGWLGKELLTKCLENRQDFKADNFLHGKLEKGTSGRTKRSRARAVLYHMERAAIDEDASNSIYFHHRYVPQDDTTEEWKNYFDVIGRDAERWAKAAKDKYYATMKEKEAVPDFGQEFAKHIKKKNNQNMKTSSLGTQLEKDKFWK